MSSPVVYVHTNEQQMLGAIASAHSFRRQSRHPERFEVTRCSADVLPDVFERIAACGACKPLAS